MKKKTYNAPVTTIVEMEIASIIATSMEYKDNGTTSTGSVDLGAEKKGADAGDARSASRLYFNSWEDEEE